MTSATVKRVFEVEAPLQEAWQRLAEVERWPEWAPHITSVTVSPPGELGPTSSGALQIKRLGRNSFRMSVWEPPVRWEWVGGLPGVRIYYDHRFESSGPAATRLEWLVELHGPLAPLYSTCLRPSVRSQSRQGDPRTAGVVSPLMAGNAGAPPCGVRRGWSANWS